MKPLNGFTIPFGVAVFCIGTLVSLGKVQEQVTQNTKARECVGQVLVDVGVLKTDVVNIKDLLGDIKIEQKEIRAEQLAAMKSIMRRLDK